MRSNTNVKILPEEQEGGGPELEGQAAHELIAARLQSIMLQGDLSSGQAAVSGNCPEILMKRRPSEVLSMLR